MSLRRCVRFAAVGLAGVAVQLGTLALLLMLLRSQYLLATALALEAAVLHNFLWHRWWTWADRPGNTFSRLLRFHAGAGLTSIAPNLLLAAWLVEKAALHPLAANAVAIACCSVASFLLTDRWVFSSPRLR